MKTHSRLRDERAMTLFELLAVVTILGILSAIAVVSFGKLISVSRDQAFIANAHTIRDAARFYLKEKIVNEEKFDGSISYKTLIETNFMEQMKDPYTGEMLAASEETYVAVRDGRIDSILLLGKNRRIAKGGGPVPFNELSREYIVRKE
ncbi:type II secretion system protein [Peribacillus sp. SCS-26]|uniref:type II secretion system protein n=1 Tax=Paraperibacillus marinus TaxID=3115295 RepID=UPI0039069DB2